MTGIITGIAIGLATTATGFFIGFYAYRYAFKSGAKMIDRIHHDQVPFDEELITEPLSSHTDGRNLDDEED